MSYNSNILVLQEMSLENIILLYYKLVLIVRTLFVSKDQFRLLHFDEVLNNP